MGLPPQPERVARPPRPLPRPEQPDQRVQLVGESDGRPTDPGPAQIVRPRRGVGGDPDRQVVVVDGAPHLFRLAVLAGVDTPHDPLQLGELADHVGGQVGLGEAGGTGRVIDGGGRAERVGGDGGGQLLDAAGLVQIAAELRVEPQRVETVEARVEGRAAVRLPEEPGVPQPRHEHPLGVAGDRRHVVLRDVGHREKVLGEAAVARRHREVVLVVDHRRLQHFLGQGEELLGEAAGDHRRVLDEIGHLVEQRTGAAGATDHAPQALRLGIELLRDAGAALLAGQQHVVPLQGLAVLGERAHPHGPAGPAVAREEAVTAGGRAGADRGHPPRRRLRRAPDDERHDAPPEQEHQPADGAPERQVAAAVVEPGVPVHLLRKGEVAQGRREHAAEHRAGGLPRLAAPMGEIGPLGGVDPDQPVDGNPLLAGEPEGGAGGLSRIGESRPGRRSRDRLFEVRLPVLDPGGVDGEPARRRERRRLGRTREPGRLQLRAQGLPELPDQRRHPARGQLLAPDLDQQLSIHDVRIPMSPPRSRTPPTRRAPRCARAPAWQPRSTTVCHRHRSPAAGRDAPRTGRLGPRPGRPRRPRPPPPPAPVRMYAPARSPRCRRSRRGC